MGQPNLSKAIKELETETGITIFKRTARGVEPTKKGELFLEHAKSILSQIEELEKLYKPKNQSIFEFDISIPRASYVTYAFTRFLKSLEDKSPKLSVNFRETNSTEAINDIINGASNIGIIRYQKMYEPYFLSLLAEKDIEYKTIWEFNYVVVMSNKHPLANQETISYQELCKGIEVVHGDFSVPSLSFSYIKKSMQISPPPKRIFIYERGSQFDLLSEVPSTFMWVSPIPEEILERYDLVQKKCSISNDKNKDILIYPKNYKLSEYDNMFISQVEEIKNNLDS